MSRSYNMYSVTYLIKKHEADPSVLCFQTFSGNSSNCITSHFEDEKERRKDEDVGSMRKHYMNGCQDVYY